MRIIAGERRGHKFDGPEDKTTRPTSDMVREAIFNLLRERAEGRVAFDVFAGSGGLGLEALSRGADRCVFVEKDRRNLALIKKNLATLKFEGRGAILGADAYKWAETLGADEPDPVLVLIDPPYRDFADRSAKLEKMLAGLVERLPRGSTIVVESDKDHGRDVLPDPDAWDVRRYGGTLVAVLDVGEGEGDAESSRDPEIP